MIIFKFLAAMASKPKADSKICRGLDEVQDLMDEKGYTLCDGMIYKKPEETKFTYVLCCDIRKFILLCLKNRKIADLLTLYVDRVVDLLSDPACGLLKRMERLHNVIEILPPGYCFLVTEKRFVKVKRFAEGHFPRAFVRYKYQKDIVPYPLPFIQGKHF